MQIEHCLKPNQPHQLRTLCRQQKQRACIMLDATPCQVVLKQFGGSSTASTQQKQVPKAVSCCC